MVLTFTGALSVAEAGRADVREMLIGALGCNLAWGIIDAVFYLMAVSGRQGAQPADLASGSRDRRPAVRPSASSRMRCRRRSQR